MSKEGFTNSQTRPARNVVPMRKKNGFCYGLRNTEYYGIRISDLCRISDTGFLPAPAYSRRDALPLGCWAVLFTGYGIAVEFGYRTYRDRPRVFVRYLISDFSQPRFIPHGMCPRGVAGWRACGMRKIGADVVLARP